MSPADQKEWLRGGRNYFKWVCFECRFPLCKQCVESGDPAKAERRPLHAVKHNARIDNAYYCMEHRYPRCSGVRCAGLEYKDRTERVISTKNRFKAWSCAQCKAAEANANEVSEESKMCLICKEQRKGKDANRNESKCCDACDFPQCAICGIKCKEARYKGMHAKSLREIQIEPWYLKHTKPLPQTNRQTTATNPPDPKNRRQRPIQTQTLFQKPTMPRPLIRFFFTQRKCESFIQDPRCRKFMSSMSSMSRNRSIQSCAVDWCSTWPRESTTPKHIRKTQTLQTQTLPTLQTTPDCRPIRQCGPVCSKCQKQKCATAFNKRDSEGHLADRCKECQHPTCDVCSKRHQGDKPIPPNVVRYVCTKCKATKK